VALLDTRCEDGMQMVNDSGSLLMAGIGEQN